MNHPSIFDPQPELVAVVDDFRWLQQLQAQIDKVQEQIDVTAIAADKLPKSSQDYRTLQKHLNLEVDRRARLMGIAEGIAKSRGYQLCASPWVFEGGDRLRYIYSLKYT